VPFIDIMKVKEIVYKINNTDIGRRIASGALWSFLGISSAKAIVLLASILCAHILTKQQFGEFGMVRSTISMFVVLGEAGLGVTATKYIAELRKRDNERIASIYLITTLFAICTGVIISIFILLFAEYISCEILNAPNLITSIKYGAIMLFVAVINGAQLGVLSGYEAFKTIAINTLFGNLAEAFFMIVGAYYWGVPGAVLGYGIGFFVLLIANRLSIKNIFNKEGVNTYFKCIQKNDLRLLYKFSLPAALSSMLIAPTYWIVKAILANNGGFEEVANFEVADQWRIIILFIPSAISQIVLPILSSIAGYDKEKFWKVLLYNLLLNGILSTIIALIFILLRPYIIGVFGANYSDTTVLVYLALSTIFSSIANVVGLSISSRAKMWEGFAFNLVWAFNVIIISYYLIKYDYGAQSIAIAILVSYILHTIYQLIYLRIVMKKRQ